MRKVHRSGRMTKRGRSVMVDREATCKWLVRLSSILHEEEKTGDEITFHNLKAFHERILDVMALILEAPSVPRIITDTDELVAHEAGVFIEYNPDRLNRPGEWAFVWYVDKKASLVTRNGLGHGHVEYSMEQYGRTWRCWTSKPNQAEMEARPWLS